MSEVRRLFSLFRQRCFSDKVHGFNAMLAALLRNGGEEEAWQLFCEMRGLGTHAPAHARLHTHSHPRGPAGAAESRSSSSGASGSSVLPPSIPPHWQRSTADSSSSSRVSGRSKDVSECEVGADAGLGRGGASRGVTVSPGAQRGVQSLPGAWDGGNTHRQLQMQMQMQAQAQGQEVQGQPTISEVVPAPDTVTYNTMIGACDRLLAVRLAGRREKEARSVQEQHEGAKGYGEGGNKEKQMRLPCPSPAGLHTNNPVVGAWDSAQAVGSSVTEAAVAAAATSSRNEGSNTSQHGTAPGSASVGVVSVSSSDADAVSLALSLYREMCVRGLSPSIRTFNTLLTLVSRKGTCEQVRR